MSEEAGGLRGGWLRVLLAAAFAAGCTAESVPRLPRHEPVQYVATAVTPPRPAQWRRASSSPPSSSQLELQKLMHANELAFVMFSRGTYCFACDGLLPEVRTTGHVYAASLGCLRAVLLVCASRLCVLLLFVGSQLDQVAALVAERPFTLQQLPHLALPAQLRSLATPLSPFVSCRLNRAGFFR